MSPVVAFPREMTNRLSVEDWARIIRADFRRSVEGIVAAGRHLREAQKEVDRSEFLQLCDRIGIHESTACKFMTIAENPVISDFSQWKNLPVSWTTLYELATRSTKFLEEKIAEGKINPGMTREDVAALCSPPVGRAAPSGDETPPPDRRDRLRRIPNGLITSWEDAEKFCEVVRHNAQVKARQYERNAWHPEDIDHELTVSVMIRVSPTSIKELDRYVALNPGINGREVMEEAIEVLCSGLRRSRLKHEERIEREQRQKYEAAIAEKRAREAQAARQGPIARRLTVHDP